MDKPMLPGGKRAVAALAAAAAALWALMGLGKKPAPPSPSARVVEALPAAGPPKRPAPKPSAPERVRGAALRDKGEALGGTPP